MQEVLVAEGDTVEAGQPLLRLRSLSQQAADHPGQGGRGAGPPGGERRPDRPPRDHRRPGRHRLAAAGLDRLSQGPRAEDVAAARQLWTLPRQPAEAHEGGTPQQIIAATAELNNAGAALRRAQAAYDRAATDAAIGVGQSFQLEHATNALNAARARLDDPNGAPRPRTSPLLRPRSARPRPNLTASRRRHALPTWP